MKKVVALVLTLVLLFSVVSVSFAAVTIGGNVRTWFYSASNENDATPTGDATGFQFDRVALTFSADVSAANGIKGEISFREADKNSASGANIVDIRVEKFWYYQKGLFSENDQLQVGYIEMPFYNANYSAITVTTLGYNYGPTNSVGVKYVVANNNMDFAIALANAQNKYQTNRNTAAKGEDGFDLSARVGFAPTENIKVGLGYANDLVDDNESYSKLIVDSNGQFGAIGYFVEYFSDGIDKKGTAYDGKTLTGTYFEGSYKLADTIKFYGGRGVCLSGDDVNFAQLSGFVTKFNVGSDFKFDNDWTVIGCAIQIAPKTVLQPEYITVDGNKSKTLIAARLRVDF